jgi:hypothetical protein
MLDCEAPRGVPGSSPDATVVVGDIIRGRRGTAGFLATGSGTGYRDIPADRGSVTVRGEYSTELARSG